MKLNDLSGARFGRWLVSGRAPNRSNQTVWVCVCDCGAVKAVSAASLRNGDSTSCGCLRREIQGQLKRSHGGTGSPEWNSYHSAKQRCFNKRNPNWPDYGGRGITMCDEWRDDFARFLSDMGLKPSPQHSLGRINNSGPYSPDNCRWETADQQAANRRRPVPGLCRPGSRKIMDRKNALVRAREAGCSHTVIAALMGVSKSTVRRELLILGYK